MLTNNSFRHSPVIFLSDVIKGFQPYMTLLRAFNLSGTCQVCSLTNYMALFRAFNLSGTCQVCSVTNSTGIRISLAAALLEVSCLWIFVALALSLSAAAGIITNPNLLRRLNGFLNRTLVTPGPQKDPSVITRQLPPRRAP